MNTNLDKIALDLYGKIQTRFPNIKIGDAEANVLSKKQIWDLAQIVQEHKLDHVKITVSGESGIGLSVYVAMGNDLYSVNITDYSNW